VSDHGSRSPSYPRGALKTLHKTVLPRPEAVLTVFASLVLTRCSEDTAQDRPPAPRHHALSLTQVCNLSLLWRPVNESGAAILPPLGAGESDGEGEGEGQAVRGKLSPNSLRGVSVEGEARSSRDLREIRPRSARDLPEISPRSSRDLPEI